MQSIHKKIASKFSFLATFMNKEYKKKIEKEIKKGKEENSVWSQFKVRLPFLVKKGSLKRICTGEKRENGVRVLYLIVENLNNKEEREDEEGNDYDL